MSQATQNATDYQLHFAALYCIQEAEIYLFGATVQSVPGLDCTADVDEV